ncbi:hypothetical protein [Anabaena sp. UHCC 0451]|uniref:hypothetical protein n=1 Tax=Anabaena sp. UHCC 0451 TaxID=2055235 RepID=UPI002B1F1652|nr:hypothetical protein [Anabaena sp. UHCC 0451]MEA5577677.1 hypothetical protein [Anabaena sp. UHCC 0451]
MDTAYFDRRKSFPFNVASPLGLQTTRSHPISETLQDNSKIIMQRRNTELTFSDYEST